MRGQYSRPQNISLVLHFFSPTVVFLGFYFCSPLVLILLSTVISTDAPTRWHWSWNIYHFTSQEKYILFPLFPCPQTPPKWAFCTLFYCIFCLSPPTLLSSSVWSPSSVLQPPLCLPVSFQTSIPWSPQTLDVGVSPVILLLFPGCLSLLTHSLAASQILVCCLPRQHFWLAFIGFSSLKCCLGWQFFEFEYSIPAFVQVYNGTQKMSWLAVC